MEKGNEASAPPPAYPGYPQQPGGAPAPQGQQGYPPQPQGYGAPPPGQYPPPGGYAQQQYPQGGPPPVMAQPHTTVVMQGTPLFGEHPCTMQCPHCHANITTSVSYSTGGLTWLVAGGLCLFGLWLGCCLIPFCIDSLKDVEHSCPNCKRMLGKKSRL